MVLYHSLRIGTVKRPYQPTKNLKLKQENSKFKILKDILNCVQIQTIKKTKP